MEVARSGVFLVDGRLSLLHDKVKAAISTISNLPVKYLINTHYHGDHTGGNEAFAKDGAVIVAIEPVQDSTFESLLPFAAKVVDSIRFR